MVRKAAGSSALIIAGGRGTRFWPASRESRPKPLFSIDKGSTLLGDAITRLVPLIKRDRIFVLVTSQQEAVFRKALEGLIPPENLILEPDGRGTAVAIAYGAAVIQSRVGEGIIAVMPADHYISPAADFRATLASAIKLASREDAIVVIGVEPTRPETGYGYQEIGRKVDGGFKVAQFIEKPALAAAKRMIRTKRYLWNAGMFVMKSSTLARELKTHCPELARASTKLATLTGPALARFYRKLKFDSFDREIVEKSDRVLGVVAKFSWHDVGTWEGLWEAMGGRSDNVLVGQVIAFDADGVLAHSHSRLMVLLGVKNIVAVDTDDALLIIDRGRSQETRRVIEELKRRGLTHYL